MRFNSRLYDKQCVLDTINAFKGMGKCSLIERGNYNIVLLKTKEPDSRKVGYEFYNYVLGLMKNTTKV